MTDFTKLEKTAWASKVAELASLSDTQLDLVVQVNPTAKRMVELVRKNRTTMNSRRLIG